MVNEPKADVGWAVVDPNGTGAAAGAEGADCAAWPNALAGAEPAPNAEADPPAAKEENPPPP